jgi:hypothetical protein
MEAAAGIEERDELNIQVTLKGKRESPDQVR